MIANTHKQISQFSIILYYIIYLGLFLLC